MKTLTSFLPWITALATLVPAAQAQTVLNVLESPDLFTPFGLIETIATAQTGVEHYNYRGPGLGPSGAPTGVNLGPTTANVWVHENTDTGEFTFGLIFGELFVGTPSNRVSFEIEVFGSLNDPFISQQDDPFDAGCTAAPSPSGALDLTFCRFRYGRNTDGIAIGGITGDSWTVIVTPIEPFFLGVTTDWFAASGEFPDFSDDLTLTLGSEYRINVVGGNSFIRPSDITRLVEELVASAAINQGRGTALTQQLQAAQEQFDRGNTAAVAGMLNGFIALVNSIRTLSAQEAQSLIDAANAINP